MDKDKLKRFFRRYGAYCFGGLLIAGLVAIAVIGKKSSGSTDIKTRYIMDAYNKQLEEYEASGLDDGDDYDPYDDPEFWDTAFGLDKLDLGYEAHIADLDGEMFIYDADFKEDIGEDTLDALDAEIVKKCGKLLEDNFYGEIFIEKTSERHLQIVLDLGNADSDKAVLGILRALNDMDGAKVERVIINDN